MKIKASQLVAFVLKAVAGMWGYVLGGQGETWSKELAEKWAKSRNKPKSWIGTKISYFVEACARWFNHKIADCSGLIIAAIRSIDPDYSDQSADGLYSRCTEKGPIKTIPEIPGICVHKPGHIGIYVGNGYVVEAKGYKVGVVKTKLKDGPWTGWGKLAAVDYSEYEGKEPKMPTLRKGSKGTVVEKLQELLNTKLGIELKVDGVFGSRTKKAVRNYQKKFGLKVDGVVGPQTWASLGY
jgi:hypothetical protein